MASLDQPADEKLQPWETFASQVHYHLNVKLIINPLSNLIHSGSGHHDRGIYFSWHLPFQTNPYMKSGDGGGGMGEMGWGAAGLGVYLPMCC